MKAVPLAAPLERDRVQQVFVSAARILKQYGSLRLARSCISIRKEAELFCGSFLRMGDVFAYVRLFQSLRDLKAQILSVGRSGPDREDPRGVLGEGG